MEKDCIEEPVLPPDDEEEEGGAPAWVMTFADLMSLLMCFFVLLLSFSEMEATKFKQMAGEMRMAFGVQREIEATEPPKGTSIIAQHFSPGKPEPTVLDEVRQTTTQEEPQLQTGSEQAAETQARADALEESLRDELDQGLIEIESKEDQIIIRIREKGSFPSGSDELNVGFIPVLMKIKEQLIAAPGQIAVVGHTDDLPISTYRFRSNWDLSAARASSVLHELLAAGDLTPDRIELKGMSDTRPLTPNVGAESRARNRRVEIVLLTGKGSGKQSVFDAPTS